MAGENAGLYEAAYQLLRWQKELGLGDFKVAIIFDDVSQEYIARYAMRRAMQKDDMFTVMNPAKMPGTEFYGIPFEFTSE